MRLQLESCIISQKKVANANTDIDNSDIPFEWKLAYLYKSFKRWCKCTIESAFLW